MFVHGLPLMASCMLTICLSEVTSLAIRPKCIFFSQNIRALCPETLHATLLIFSAAISTAWCSCRA